MASRTLNLLKPIQLSGSVETCCGPVRDKEKDSWTASMPGP